MAENVFISINIAVVTISDTRKSKNDRSGDTLVSRITQFGHNVTGKGGKLVSGRDGNYNAGAVADSNLQFFKKNYRLLR